jgi:hypothetical protein
MVEAGFLRGIDQAVLTIDASPHDDWLRTFPVSHLAEHLIGRELADLPFVLGLTGHVRQSRISIRFLAPRERFGEAAMRELAELTAVSQETFQQEVRILGIEDQILTEPLRSAGRLPASLADFQQAWKETRQQTTLDWQPYLGGRLEDFIEADPADPAQADPAQSDPGPAEPGNAAGCEYGDARESLCRRLRGIEPELLMDAGPVGDYYGLGSVFLAGLSAYRSPLLRALRAGPEPVYMLKLFDFPWRHRSFIACITKPSIGRAAFATVLGPRIERIIAELTAEDLRTVLHEGTVHILEELTTLLDKPGRRAGLGMVANLNGFSAHPKSLAESVLNCGPATIASYREHFLQLLSRQLDQDARETI